MTLLLLDPSYLRDEKPRNVKGRSRSYERRGIKCCVKRQIVSLFLNLILVFFSLHTVRVQIILRKDQLQQRKQTLELAKQKIDQEILEQSSMEDTLIAERWLLANPVVDTPLDLFLAFRNRLEKLRNQLTPIRTILITTLSGIYPIDLVSPPDLLFTILSAPLPIPLTASDPGPPLSLPDHKEVNEDAIATALGYAAQVVHFLAAYLGKTLVYPVTYVGSRSLIRDGISAMVGPRMYVYESCLRKIDLIIILIGFLFFQKA